jgi:hypothetical protein
MVMVQCLGWLWLATWLQEMLSVPKNSKVNQKDGAIEDSTCKSSFSSVKVSHQLSPRVFYLLHQKVGAHNGALTLTLLSHTVDG